MFDIFDDIFELDDMDMITFVTVFEEDELEDFDEYWDRNYKDERY